MDSASTACRVAPNELNSAKGGRFSSAPCNLNIFSLCEGVCGDRMIRVMCGMLRHGGWNIQPVQAWGVFVICQGGRGCKIPLPRL